MLGTWLGWCGVVWLASLWSPGLPRREAGVAPWENSSEDANPFNLKEADPGVRPREATQSVQNEAWNCSQPARLRSVRSNTEPQLAPGEYMRRNSAIQKGHVDTQFNGSTDSAVDAEHELYAKAREPAMPTGLLPTQESDAERYGRHTESFDAKPLTPSLSKTHSGIIGSATPRGDQMTRKKRKFVPRAVLQGELRDDAIPIAPLPEAASSEDAFSGRQSPRHRVLQKLVTERRIRTDSTTDEESVQMLRHTSSPGTAAPAAIQVQSPCTNISPGTPSRNARAPHRSGLSDFNYFWSFKKLKDGGVPKGSTALSPKKQAPSIQHLGNQATQRSAGAGLAERLSAPRAASWQRAVEQAERIPKEDDVFVSDRTPRRDAERLPTADVGISQNNGSVRSQASPALSAMTPLQAPTYRDRRATVLASQHLGGVPKRCGDERGCDQAESASREGFAATTVPCQAPRILTGGSQGLSQTERAKHRTSPCNAAASPQPNRQTTSQRRAFEQDLTQYGVPRSRPSPSGQRSKYRSNDDATVNLLAGGLLEDPSAFTEETSAAPTRPLLHPHTRCTDPFHEKLSRNSQMHPNLEHEPIPADGSIPGTSTIGMQIDETPRRSASPSHSPVKQLGPSFIPLTSPAAAPVWRRRAKDDGIMASRLRRVGFVPHDRSEQLSRSPFSISSQAFVGRDASSPIWGLLHRAVESISGGLPGSAPVEQRRRPRMPPHHRFAAGSRLRGIRRRRPAKPRDTPTEPASESQISDLSEALGSPAGATRILAELDAAHQENEVLREHLSRMAVQLDALRSQQKRAPLSPSDIREQPFAISQGPNATPHCLDAAVASLCQPPRGKQSVADATATDVQRDQRTNAVRPNSATEERRFPSLASSDEHARQHRHHFGMNTSVSPCWQRERRSGNDDPGAITDPKSAAAGAARTLYGSRCKPQRAQGTHPSSQAVLYPGSSPSHSCQQQL